MTPRDRHLRTKYGITEEEYEAWLARQGGHCGICGNLPKTRRLAVDHQHIKGYKNLPPQEKRNYVRGICCFHCNWIMLSRGVTLEKAKGLVRYLEDYERRKAIHRSGGKLVS